MKERKVKVKLVELVKQDRISLKLALADSEGGGGVAVSRQIMPAIGVVCNKRRVAMSRPVPAWPSRAFECKGQIGETTGSMGRRVPVLLCGRDWHSI